MNGTVNPNGLSTTAYFQYGTSTSYGSTTSSQSIGSGTSSTSITAGLTGLSSGITYYYRAVATNSAGTTYGSGQTFTTSYTVTPSAGSNGTISPSTAQTVNSGSTTSFTITPNSGYSISSATGCSGTLSGSTYTTGAITSNCTVTATFADITAPSNGTLSASASSGQVSLSWSGFSDSGSGISSYKLVYATGSTPSSCSSGTQIYSSTGTSYTHTGLSSGTTYYYHVCATDNAGNTSTGATASATTTTTLYTVTPSAGSNGTISPSTAQTVNSGSSASFTITPNSGYSISSVTGCSGTLSGNTYTTGAITSNCTVTASFALTPCSYSISPTSNSLISFSSTDSVSVTATSGCSWTAASNVSWITISSGSNGNGNGTVYYSVSANTSTSSRSGTLTIAGQTFTVTQSGVSDTIAPTTTANPAGGTYSSAQTVSLTADETATIYYTSDGSEPTTSSTVYSSPISISTTKTLKFFAKDLAGNSEAVKTEAYLVEIPGSTKIAFASNRDGNYEIYVMDTDGTNQTRLTNNTASDSGPSWSPDGTKITFTSDRDGNAEIYVMNADGTNQTRLTNNSAGDGRPLWSPDGTKILFQTLSDGNQGEVYVMNADGTNPVNLTNNSANDGDASWSPDGAKIAFASWRNGGSNIFVMNADGTNPTQLTSGLWAGSTAWSPDGSKIAFSNSGAIYVMNVDGSNLTAVLTVSGSVSPYVGSWSPDGTKMVIFSDRFDGNYEVYIINSDGTNRINISNNTAADTDPSWSPVTTDSTPPTGTISINSGAASTNSTSATLTLSCTDASGCSEMQFSNDNSTWSTAEAYATSKAWTLASGDGTKTVYVKFKDTAGNWSTVTISDTIVLDTTAPTTTASPAGGTYTSTQSVTLTCSDGTGSGCDKIYYTTDGSTPSTLSTVYTTPITVSATTTLKFFAKDLAGNSEAAKSEAYTIETSSGVTTLVSGLNNPSGIAADSNSVYWAENAANGGSIKKVSINGGPATTLASSLNAASGGQGSLGFNVVVDSDSVYWGEASTVYDGNDAAVRKVPINGGTVTTLASGLNQLVGIAADSTNVYWAEQGLSKVSKVAKGGGTATTLGNMWNYPIGVAVDSTSIYGAVNNNWWAGNGSVQKISTDSGTATTLASGLNAPFSIAVDTTSVYWTDYHVYNGGNAQQSDGTGAVKKVSVTGGTVTTLATGLNRPSSIVVDSASGYVYWTETGTYSGDTLNNGTGTIKKVPIEGGTVTLLASGLNSPGNVAVDSTSVYWSESGTYTNGVYDTGTGTIKKMLKGTAPTGSANDSCSSAKEITGNSYIDTMDTTNATSAGDDPGVCAGNNDKSVWYKYTATSNGTVTVDTNGSSYDTVLAAYTGTCGSFSPYAACNDDYSGLQSQITLDITAGTTYYFKVSSHSSAGGTMVVNFSVASSSGDTILPTTTASPAGGTYSSAQTVSLTADETATIYYTSDGSEPTTSSSVYSTPINISATTTLKFFAKDLAGNSETVKSEAYTLDTTPPTGTISINSGAASTNSTSVTLTLSCTDTSGCSEMQFSNDNTTWSTAETYTTSKTWTLSSGDETKTVYVKFKDTAGNWSTAYSDTIVLDTAAPDTSITNQPSNPTNSTSASFSFTSTETGSTFQCQLDSGGYSSCTSPASYTSLSDGSHTFYVKATDTAGNTDTTPASYTWTIDTTAPTVTINAVTTPTSSTSQTITGTVETGATVNVSRDTAASDGAAIVTGTTWSYTITGLVEGANNITVTATDAAGNTAMATAVVVLDTIVPVLTLSTLSNNSVTNNNTLNISGTATDNTGVQGLTINGNPVTINADGSFSHALILNEGANVITTVATDLTGNQTTDTRTITLDITAPALVIDTPADNSKTAASIATVTGTIDENSTVAVTLNGGTPQYASVTGSTFTLDIVLASGVNTIEVTATDTAGNTSTEKRTVTYDNTKPSLEITEPNQDIRTNQGSIIIKGAISDALTAVSVSVTVDGNTYNPAISNGQFEQAVTFIAEKTYTVTVTATDEAGNTTTAQRNIIYDITQPVINFTTTTPTNNTSQTITGTMEEGATVTVTSVTATVGTVTYPSSTTWRVNVTGMTEGSNTITATAKDTAGNETTVAKQIVVDTVAPVTTATPGGGTYSSAQGVTLVTNETATIYYTTDGTTPTTSSTVYVFPISITKTTTLKYFAKDRAGNRSAVSSETYTINPVSAIDTTPPSNVSYLNATSNADGSISLSWTAPTDADLKGYSVYRDSVKINSEAITKSTVTYTDTDTVSGTVYTYKVTSLDMAGNESTGVTKSIAAVAQDNTPPSAVSSIKVEDTKTGGSLKVVWTANTEADLSGYKVYLGTSSGSYTNTYEAGNTTAYTVTGLNDGAKYYIAVTAYDTDGNESAKSVESTESPTTATITLNPPTNLTVTTGNEYITLSWTGVSNVTGYLVYIGNTDGAYGTSARTTNTTYTYSNLNNNQTYYVAVSSYTNNGSSDTISAESERTASSGTPSDNNPPSSPTNITATTGTSGSVSLKWDRAEDSDISGYMLAYKESGSSTFTGMVSISAQWSYTITGLTDGVTYDFYLYAYDKNGNFSEPATTSATPTNSGSTADLTPPSPPILSAVPGDKKVTLIITASSDTDIDIDHYNLYVYNLASEKYMPLTSINGLTYEHSEGVGNGEALVYVATAVDASGNESGYSEAASAVANELPGDIPLEEDPPVADRVDGYDVNEMAKGFGTEIGDLDYNPNADLTGDGTVDGDDLLILGTNHGKKKE